jgi:hypothetical protein
LGIDTDQGILEDGDHESHKAHHLKTEERHDGLTEAKNKSQDGDHTKLIAVRMPVFGVYALHTQ